jgi:hypothetical protein
LIGPASAYPTFKTPASIRFKDPNDVFVPGLIAGILADFDLLVCAVAGPIMPTSADAIVMTAVAKKRRRS